MSRTYRAVRHSPTSHNGRAPSWANVALGIVTISLATAISAALPDPSSGGRFACVIAATALFAGVTRDWLAIAATNAFAWLAVNRLVVDQFGELAWHGPADLYRAAVIVMAGSAGHIAGTAWQLSRHLAR